MLMRGFESIQQEQEIWECLKRGVVPLKFAYVGDAAITHDHLANSDNYHKVVRPEANEYRFLRDMISDNSLSYIMDIGSGNGVNTTIFIESIKSMGFEFGGYFCCDFSSDLLAICVNRLREKFPTNYFSKVVCDIERRSIKSSELTNQSSTNVLVTFLGHTIGNVTDVVGTLRNIFNSTPDGAHFLFGVTLRGEQFSASEAVDDYRTEVFKAAALEPLAMSGITLDDGFFDIKYSEEYQSVICEFVFNKEQTIVFDGDEINFGEGERINCFISRRFSDTEITQSINEAGWTIIEKSMDSSGSHALYYCEKKKVVTS